MEDKRHNAIFLETKLSNPCVNHDKETQLEELNNKLKDIKNIIKPTKQSEGKLFYEIDWEFIEGMATRMALNKQNGKYDVFGWRDNGVDISEMNQALVRHLVAILKGELQDDEQQYSHYYALACNSMLIVNSLKTQIKHDIK